MAHYAELNDQNIVLRVIVFDVEGAPEISGEQLCAEIYGGRWKQTSYNNNLRKNFAGIGFLYDEEHDAFVAPQPYPSWKLDPLTYKWTAPIPTPGENYVWDELSQNWVLPAQIFFSSYGLDQPAELVQKVMAKHKMSNFGSKVLYQDDDIVIGITLVNNVIFGEFDVKTKYSPSVADKFITKSGQLQKMLGTPIYVIDTKPNNFYADITLSPLWRLVSNHGFEFLENAVFAGESYFIMRRMLNKIP